MPQRVSRTIAVSGHYLHLVGAALLTIGCVLPVWAIYYRTQVVDARSVIPAGLLRPAMIELPATADFEVFAIAESEITQSQFHRVLRHMPDQVARIGSDAWNGCPILYQVATSSDMPVTCVSPLDATKYANALTADENNRAIRYLTQCYDNEGKWTNRDCTGYRLPTIAEWQYAAHAGSAGALSRTDREDHCGQENLSQCDGSKHPRAVKSRQLSAWYLYDMYGNAAELVMNEDGTSWRALGGSWESSVDIEVADKDVRMNTVGMRMVRARAKGTFFK
jgi:formylglycine-generating enzyme required for sulfatase activity